MRVSASLLEKMREEMGRAWKDFFEKNPCEKEPDILREIEKRMRRVSTGSLRSGLKRKYRRVKTRRRSYPHTSMQG